MKIKLDPVKGLNAGTTNVGKLQTTTHGTNLSSGAVQSVFNQSSAATNAAANAMSSSSGAKDRSYPPALV
jgi:type IV secretory pathway VirB6-like protein